MRDLMFLVGFTAVAIGICILAGASTGLTIVIAGVVVIVGAADMKPRPIVSNNFFYGQ